MTWPWYPQSAAYVNHSARVSSPGTVPASPRLTKIPLDQICIAEFFFYVQVRWISNITGGVDTKPAEWQPNAYGVGLLFRQLREASTRWPDKQSCQRLVLHVYYAPVQFEPHYSPALGKYFIFPYSTYIFTAFIINYLGVQHQNLTSEIERFFKLYDFTCKENHVPCIPITSSFLSKSIISAHFIVMLD